MNPYVLLIFIGVGLTVSGAVSHDRTGFLYGVVLWAGSIILGALKQARSKR